jgi:hypothetical protein
MKIEKFTHVDNGKTIYAVIGEPNETEAKLAVCRYKKDSRDDFMNTHKVYTGLIKNKKLYVINIDVTKDYDNLIPCYIIARDSIDLDSYING